MATKTAYQHSDVPSQLGARLPQRDGRWFCRRRFTRSLAAGAVELFFYDTAPFVQYYYDREWANNRGAICTLKTPFIWVSRSESAPQNLLAA